MSLNSLKLTDNMIAQKGVVAAPDHLVGNAQDNKKVFDRLIRESLKQLFNGLIDALSSAGGAGEIGAAVVGVSGDTVQSVLTAMKTLLDSKAADADMEAALLLKADATVAAAHFKTVEFDPDTGKFTFTRENGSKVEIDTALEKVATNWTYDAETQALVLTLADGSTQRVSLSDFITTTEFVSSESVQFSVSGGKVTARVLPGGIDETMLSSALLTMLRDYVSQAAASATAAGASESQAKEYKNSAASDAAAAKQSATAAKESETKAKASETKAAESETGAADEADRAKSEADRAEEAANRAAGAADGVTSVNGMSGDVTIPDFVAGGSVLAGLSGVAKTAWSAMGYGKYGTNSTYQTGVVNTNLNSTADHWNVSGAVLDMTVRFAEGVKTAPTQIAMNLGTGYGVPTVEILYMGDDGALVSQGMLSGVTVNNALKYYDINAEGIAANLWVVRMTPTNKWINLQAFGMSATVKGLMTGDAYDKMLTEVDKRISNAIDEIPEPEAPESDVFYATYGTTTTAELEAALNAGKAVYCVNGAYTANFLRRNTAATRHIFGFQGGTQGEYLCENDVWSTSTVSFAPKSHAASHKTGGTDAIAPEDIGAAAASHNQAASTITAGTLGGQVKANATAAATVGTAQVRDIYAGTSDMTAGTTALTTGTLYIVYE